MRQAVFVGILLGVKLQWVLIGPVQSSEQCFLPKPCHHTASMRSLRCFKSTVNVAAIDRTTATLDLLVREGFCFCYEFGFVEWANVPECHSKGCMG